MPIGDVWQRCRKFVQAMLSPTVSNSWQPKQAAEAPRLAYDLLKNPERYEYLFERYSAIVSLFQGFNVAVPREEEASHVNTIMSIMHTIERTSAPGSYVVDMIPALRYLPEFLAKFKKEARQLHDFEFTYFRRLVDEARKKYEATGPQKPPCFAHAYFENQQYWDLSDFEAVYTLGTIYEGGSGTTSSAVKSFCLAMCHYPEW
jgi:cytochrome P450